MADSPIKHWPDDHPLVELFRKDKRLNGVAVMLDDGMIFYIPKPVVLSQTLMDRLDVAGKMRTGMTLRVDLQMDLDDQVQYGYVFKHLTLRQRFNNWWHRLTDSWVRVEESPWEKAEL